MYRSREGFSFFLANSHNRRQVYHWGGLQKNSRVMPGNFQPLARIGVACCPIFLMAQTEETGARVMRAY
jgi:hypothetical protein